MPADLMPQQAGHNSFQAEHPIDEQEPVAAQRASGNFVCRQRANGHAGPTLTELETITLRHDRHGVCVRAAGQLDLRGV